MNNPFKLLAIIFSSIVGICAIACMLFNLFLGADIDSKQSVEQEYSRKLERLVMELAECKGTATIKPEYEFYGVWDIFYIIKDGSDLYTLTSENSIQPLLTKRSLDECLKMQGKLSTVGHVEHQSLWESYLDIIALN